MGNEKDYTNNQNKEKSKKCKQKIIKFWKLRKQLKLKIVVERS